MYDTVAMVEIASVNYTKSYFICNLFSYAPMLLFCWFLICMCSSLIAALVSLDDPFRYAKNYYNTNALVGAT